MFHTARVRAFGFTVRRIAPISGAILSAILFCAGPVRAQVVATSDFEDGTTEDWTSFNNASTPVNSSDVAYTGTHSLLTRWEEIFQGLIDRTRARLSVKLKTIFGRKGAVAQLTI